MARIARVVVPGVPHHVTQRGNRRMDVFFSDEDRLAYLELLREFGEKYGVRYWGWCLMSNHVHLIAVPESAESLARGVGGAHQAYTRRINFREGWRGYLWQGRFFSCPLDEAHAERALCYVENNPVRAKRVSRAEEWRWSSARGHVGSVSEEWTARPPFQREGREWRALLRPGTAAEEMEALRRCTRTGRPLGTPQFVERIERALDRILKRGKPGPKPKLKRWALRGKRR
jgi:putative transposase